MPHQDIEQVYGRVECVLDGGFPFHQTFVYFLGFLGTDCASLATCWVCENGEADFRYPTAHLPHNEELCPLMRNSIIQKWIRKL
ncbi:hypothetical protein J6590_000279 [Homalodisca vitripennis]|nr:hypothetical protein J6590_000279 [Homalodisca vitripennis]